jgi:ABC-type transport system involved in multi-copper enzyme maturation permease subunit
MSTAIAAQMARADFLKLRKKRGTLIWSLVLGLAPIVIYFVVRAIQHASDPAKHGPAGGLESFHDGLRLLGGLLFGPLVAILIGVEAGTNDASAGVFRDLVVTGRSRLALFATRIPAALALCWTVVVSGYVLILLGTFIFASGQPTPDTSLILDGLGFLLLATGVLCAVAVGFASLTTSKPASIIALIAWQLVAGPLIVSIDSLGSARNLVLSQALAHFSPLSIGDNGGRGGVVSMSAGVAVLVIALWLVVFVGLGAWRTRTMDS